MQPRLLSNARGKQHSGTATTSGVGEDRVPVLDEGVAHHIQVLGFDNVPAHKSSDTVVSQRTSNVEGSGLIDDGSVAQGEHLNVLTLDGTQVEVERVDGEGLAGKLDGRNVVGGGVAGEQTGKTSWSVQ